MKRPSNTHMFTHRFANGIDVTFQFNRRAADTRTLGLSAEP